MMYETNMVEIDSFNMGQVEDNCWGFDSYYDRYVWIEEQSYEED